MSVKTEVVKKGMDRKIKIGNKFYFLPRKNTCPDNIGQITILSRNNQADLEEPFSSAGDGSPAISYLDGCSSQHFLIVHEQSPFARDAQKAGGGKTILCFLPMPARNQQNWSMKF